MKKKKICISHFFKFKEETYIIFQTCFFMIQIILSHNSRIFKSDFLVQFDGYTLYSTENSKNTVVGNP